MKRNAATQYILPACSLQIPFLSVVRRQSAIKDVPEKISLSQEYIQLIADKDQPYDNQNDSGNPIDIF